MTHAAPWWLERVNELVHPRDVQALALGALWGLSERLRFVRENVDPGLLRIDCEQVTGATETWAGFEQRERDVARALESSGEACATRLRNGTLGPDAFRDSWQRLGYVRHADGGGTPADDYLDGLLHLSRLSAFAAPVEFGLLNLATRAERVADFLEQTNPGRDDVVFDLGSGSGKLALTVAASTVTTVRGVEFEADYVMHARRSADWLGLRNATFAGADVRDVDLSSGSIFYLYYPFHGRVARTIAQRLGALARQKHIVVYASGPAFDFGEFFLAQVHEGALCLRERRGEYGEVMVLASAPATDVT